MISLNRRWLGGLMFAAVFPNNAQAQVVARSFDDLQRILKVGEKVVVTEDSGEQTRGKVANVSATSLTVLTPGKQLFLERTVAQIRRSDSLWNGALIGAGVGGLTFFAGTGIEDDPAVYYWLYIGSWLFPTTGAIVGALLDRATGNEPIYVTHSRQPAVALSPWFGRKGTGISVSLRF
jgi:hypothetical protein